MVTWRSTLGGFVVWTGHFFGVYAAGSLFPGSSIARVLTLVLTVIALAAVGWQSWRVLRRPPGAIVDDVTRWLSGLALAGCAMAGIAILYQGLPAVLA